jgi:D-alanyl-D-alanine carboxypeptidase
VAEQVQPRQRLSPTDIPANFAPEATLPALERLLQAPGTVGLAAFEVGKEDQGVYLNADAQMPLASVVKILNLIAYANAVADGQLDPGSWIPVEELDRFYLPGMDLGAHRRALNDLEEKSLVAQDPPSVPLEEVPMMMIRHSSNAAADYLHMTIGQEKLEQTAQELGLDSQTAPCPWIGQFLAINNPQSHGNDWLTVNEYIENPAIYGQEVMRLSDAFANDADFRNDVLNSRQGRTQINVQALFSENLNAQATPRDYADLMAKIINNELNTSYSNILVRRVMEWPMIFPANQELFSTVGFKNGSLPGILTVSYYAQRLEDGAQVVVVLFYRDLPMQTYRNWRQSLTHDELARWLLAEPEAIPELKSLLEQSRQ